MAKPTPPKGKQFSSEYQPAGRGRKPSIKRQLERQLSLDGSFTIPMSQVKEIVNDKPAKGRKGSKKYEPAVPGYVVIEIPKEEAIVSSLLRMALKGNMQAITLIMEQLDGKATQRVELDIPPTSPIPLDRAKNIQDGFYTDYEEAGDDEGED